MPYITGEEREKYRPAVRQLVNTVKDEIPSPEWARLGSVNYIITSLLNGVFPCRRYHTMVYVIGTLICVALEFYRRRAAPYEDEKIKENGDVY